MILSGVPKPSDIWDAFDLREFFGTGEGVCVEFTEDGPSFEGVAGVANPFIGKLTFEEFTRERG